MENLYVQTTRTIVSACSIKTRKRSVIYALHSARVVVGSSVGLPRLLQLAGDLLHVAEVLSSLAGLVQQLKGHWVVVTLKVLLKGRTVLIPLLNQRLLGSSGSSSSVISGGGLGDRLPAVTRQLRGILALTLTALGRVGCGSPTRDRRWGSRAQRLSVVVVNPSHVVSEVPVAGESAARDGTVTSLVGAKVGLVSMPMHGMGLTLMSKEAGGRGKAGVLARIDLASVGL